MPAPHECPEVVRWPALFAGPLTPDEEAHYEAHLKSCPACRERLDREGEADEMVSLARLVGDPTGRAPDPNLNRVITQLRGANPLSVAGPTVEPDLYFLRPPGRPGLLGRLGGYDVLGVIGQGGFGVVLKAFEPALHRLVAIKVMSPALAGSATARRRFRREAQAAAAVSHDHVVTVHGVQEQDGLPFLVMQYIGGESLQERIHREGPLDVLEVVRIGMQTAQGLAAAHAQGLIHRDIKPSNLLLENGVARVKITDFGLARTAGDVGLTQTGVVAGTPEYMAPEQAGEAAVDHRCDLFSLGSVLYAMCTGRPPFRGTTILGVLRQVSDHEPPPVRSINPDVPAWLDEFIFRLLEKDPASRPQEAVEVASLLEGYLAHLRQPVTVPAPRLPAAAAHRPGRREGETAGSGWWSGKALVALACCSALLILAALRLTFVAYRNQTEARKLAWRDALARELAGQNQASLSVKNVAVIDQGEGDTRSLRGGDPQAVEGGDKTHARMMQEYSHSLKNIADYPRGLQRCGPEALSCVFFEPEGLRIALPAGYSGPTGSHGERPDTGVIVPLAVRGDFDISVSYEILREPRPNDAGYPQTKVSLDLAIDRDAHTATTLSRRVIPEAGIGFLAWMNRWDLASDQQKERGQEFPSGKRSGRLRVTRVRSLISYRVSEGGGPFRLVWQCPFSDKELEDVRVTASTGGPKAAFEVRLTDLQIRGDSLRAAAGRGP